MRIGIRSSLIVIGLLALMAPSAAAARVPAGFLGVQSWEPLTATDSQMLAGTRAGTFRAVMFWSQIEPKPGLRNWSLFDNTVANASLGGATVLPVLLSSPAHAAVDYHDPPVSPEGRAAFAAFAHDAVQRYGPSGSFWAARPDLPFRPIRQWQIWNEPNFPAYWFDRPNPRQYASLLRLARGAIKSADGGAKIVLGGIPETRYPGAMRLTRFLKGLYKARARKLFDAVAIHPYASNIKHLKRTIGSTRKIMARYKDRRKRLYVTEIGWATAGEGKRAYRTSMNGQAKRLRQAFSYLAKRRRKDRIGMVVWFALRDRAPNAGESNWWALNTGLLDMFGNPKPAWSVFARL